MLEIRVVFVPREFLGYTLNTYLYFLIIYISTSIFKTGFSVHNINLYLCGQVENTNGYCVVVK